jgi:SNF2 family DNA or RNA helicase
MAHRKIPPFGAIPDGAEYIDIDDVPNFHNMSHADYDEDSEIKIKVEPGTETSTAAAGLGNSLLKPKQAVPPPKPMDSEKHHAQQQAIFAQFFAARTNLGDEQVPSREQTEDCSESAEDLQNPIELEHQYMQDMAVYMQKKQVGAISQEDELEFMKKTSAYNKRKRNLAALMEDEEDPLFEPPGRFSGSADSTVQSAERPKKKAKTSKSRNGVPRASKLVRLAMPNLRGHADFWENADAAEQMATEPEYEAVEGGRDAGFKALRKQVSKAGLLDMKRLKEAGKSFTNSKGVAKYVKGIARVKGGWTMKGMLTPLKNYQIINCGWMRRQEMRASEPKGGILADQMGLGKTVTCIANIVNGRPLKTYPPHLQPKSHTTLIVVPPSLLGQWKTEIERHAVSETTRKKRGLGRPHVFKDSDSENHHFRDFDRRDIVLTTYYDVRASWPAHEIPEGLSEAEKTAFFMENIYEKRGPLHRYDFLRIVLDEGHQISNPVTQIAKACSNLVADHKWVLSGTPMVNGSKDLYSLLSFIGHPTVSNMKFESFKSRFCNLRDPMSLDALSQEMVDSVACFTHKDKLLDARLITLPKPHNKSLKLHPTILESEIYSVVRARFKERAQSLGENGEMKSNKFHIWAMFTLLRQLTAHPLLVPIKVSDYLEPEDFVKIEKAVEKQAASNETPVSTIHAFRDLMKRQRTRAEARVENDIKIDMSATGTIDEYNEGIEDVEELRAPSVIKKSRKKKGTGESHGKDVNYGGYIESFKRSANFHLSSKRTICSKCERPTDNPVMTLCYHFYCRLHLEDLMHEAAHDGFDQAICVKEDCGKQIMKSTIVDPETALKPKYLDTDGNVLPSTKTLACKAQILNWLDPKTGGDPNAKCIVFCQWRNFLNLLSRICETEKWEYATLHGSMNKKARNVSIDKFKTNPNIKILIATLKTGGQGLNLTCARYVLNVDPWWNSATEIQAFSRVYRIGQEHETEFVNLTLLGTVDEHLNSIKDRKKKEIDQVNAGHKRLTTQDLLRMFEPPVKESSEGSDSEKAGK